VRAKRSLPTLGSTRRATRRIRSRPSPVDVAIENKDVGFVRAGQAAELKLVTFRFKRYGTVPATVKFVSQDAVRDEKKGALFQARLALCDAVLRAARRR
jgi:hemolysin D